MACLHHITLSSCALHNRNGGCNITLFRNRDLIPVIVDTDNGVPFSLSVVEVLGLLTTDVVNILSIISIQTISLQYIRIA